MRKVLLLFLILSSYGFAVDTHQIDNATSREIDNSDRLLVFTPLAFDAGSKVGFGKPVYVRKSPTSEIIKRGNRTLQKNTLWSTYYQEGKALIPKDELHETVEPDLTKPYCRIWPGPGQTVPSSKEWEVGEVQLDEPPEINYVKNENGEVRGEIMIHLSNGPFHTIECHASNTQMTWKLVQEVLGVSLKLQPVPFSVPTDKELKAVGRISGPDVPIGTGTIIFGNYVLTAAHVVTKKHSKTKANNIEFEPNFLESERPYLNRKVENHKPVKVEEVFIHPNYNPSKIPDENDVALIRLEPPSPGKTWEDEMGSFDIERPNEKSPFIELAPLTAVGYPMNDPARYIYPGRWGIEMPDKNIIESQRAEAKNLPQVFYTFEKPKTPTAGVSGGPYLRKREGKFKIAAIHVSGNDYGTDNQAVNTAGVYSWIFDTIEQGQKTSK